MSAVPTGGTIQSRLTVPDIDASNVLSFNQNNFNYEDNIEKSRDINLEEIEAPAVIIIQSLSDSSIKYITNKFLLQSVTKPRMERFQIIETFREARLYFFGQRTKVYSLSGQLLEGLDLNAAEGDFETRDQYRWSTSLQQLYDKTLRGSQLAAAGNIASLIFEKAIMTGYPLQLQTTRTTESPYLTQFQMTWAVYNELFLDNYSSDLGTTDYIRVQELSTTSLEDQINKLDGVITNFQGSAQDGAMLNDKMSSLQAQKTAVSQLQIVSPTKDLSPIKI